MADRPITLLTGGTGFVGAHIARLLVERGDRIRVLCRENSDRSLLVDHDVEWQIGDLGDSESLKRAVEGCRKVYHCAADYRLFARKPAQMYSINVDGTESLLEACRSQGVEKIVYTSSVAALAVPNPGRVSDESSVTTVKKVVGHYKRSKFLAQELVLEAAAAGLPVVLVNPSTPVGPGDIKPTATGKIVVDFLNGRMPAYLETGLNLVPVEDVARGHLLAEKLGKNGRLYILGHLNMTLREILEMLQAITGLKAPKLKIPYPVAWTAGWVDTIVEGYLLGRDPQIPIEGVKMARRKMFFDSQRAHRELGFQPGSVKSALTRAVDWFVAQGYAPAPPSYSEHRRMNTL